MYSNHLLGRPLLRPQTPPHHRSSLRHLHTEKSPSPPTTFIANILRTTDHDTWTSNHRLNQLLSSNSPPLSSRDFFRIARQLGNSTAALNFFYHLQQSTSPPPVPASLSSTFQAIFELASREPDAAKRVLDLLNSSKQFNLKLTVGAAKTLIRVFGRATMGAEAMGVYSDVDPGLRNTGLRNALVEALLRSGLVDEALQVLDEMLQPGAAFLPDRATADVVFAGFLRRDDDGGRSLGDDQIVRLVLKLGERGLYPDSLWLTQIITRLCRCGRSAKGWEILQSVMKSTARLETPPCNALLTVLAREGEVEKMNMLMRQMKEKGITPNVVTFGIVINDLCKSSKLDLALDVLRKIKRGDDGIVIKPDVIIYNTLIDGLCKAGRLDEARDMVERMESEDQCIPNAVTYNALLGGLSKAGELDEARGMFDLMSKKGVEPNIRTANTLINAMCRHGKVSSALEFLERIEDQGLKGNGVTYTPLIGAFCNVNNIGRAMNLFKRMRRERITDPIVYYTLISGLSQAGRIDDACSIAEEMKTNGFAMDAMCYNVLIGALCKKNKKEKAVKLLMEMEEARIKPDAVTYNTLIAFFSKVGNFELVHRLLTKMLEDGLKPTVVTFGAIIRAYCCSGDINRAMRVFREMASSTVVPPNTIIYNTLIECLCKKKNVKEALSLFDDMIDKHVRPSTNTFNSLFKGLQEINQLDKAFALMDKMTEQACDPDYITMEILTDWLSDVGETRKLKKFLEGYNVSTSTACLPKTEKSTSAACLPKTEKSTSAACLPKTEKSTSAA